MKKIEPNMRKRDLQITIEYLEGTVTMKSIGDQWGITDARIAQIIDKMLRIANHPRHHEGVLNKPPSFPRTVAREHKDYWIKVLKELLSKEIF